MAEQQGDKIPVVERMMAAVEAEFLQNGKSLTKVPMELPPADAAGRIPYVMTIPAATIPPGRYEIRAAATQGDGGFHYGQRSSFIVVASAQRAERNWLEASSGAASCVRSQALNPIFSAKNSVAVSVNR